MIKDLRMSEFLSLEAFSFSLIEFMQLFFVISLNFLWFLWTFLYFSQISRFILITQWYFVAFLLFLFYFYFNFRCKLFFATKKSQNTSFYFFSLFFFCNKINFKLVLLVVTFKQSRLPNGIPKEQQHASVSEIFFFLIYSSIRKQPSFL